MHTVSTHFLIINLVFSVYKILLANQTVHFASPQHLNHLFQFARLPRFVNRSIPVSFMIQTTLVNQRNLDRNWE